MLLHPGQSLHSVALANVLAISTASKCPAEGRPATQLSMQTDVVATISQQAVELHGHRLIIM